MVPLFAMGMSVLLLCQANEWKLGSRLLVINEAVSCAVEVTVA